MCWDKLIYKHWTRRQSHFAHYSPNPIYHEAESEEHYNSKVRLKEHLEKILCAVTFANPIDKMIEGCFSSRFQETAALVADG